jgi:aconitate hydratase
MKWGMQAFDTFKVVPRASASCISEPGVWRGVHQKDGVYYRMRSSEPTAFRDDDQRHWRGGLGRAAQAEAGMLGQPVYFLTPTWSACISKESCIRPVPLPAMVLTVAKCCAQARRSAVIEFFGEGSRPVADRATIANMAPSAAPPDTGG